jgi:AcrR family transcriptional regulator
MPFPAKTNADTIVQTALEVLQTSGLEAISMRNLADALQIKAPSLYRHFPDRAALEGALCDAIATQLHATLHAASNGRKPAPALRAAGNAYLDFARAHGAWYDLYSTRPQPSSGASKDLWNLVLALTGALTGRADDTPSAVALWSYLHGFVALERAGAFGASGDRDGFSTGLEALIQGLRDAA